MASPRQCSVDPAVTRYYHCISQCARQSPLFGGECGHRKVWIAELLQELAGIFAVEVCGFSIQDAQLELLLRLNPEKADAWPELEVVQRWMTLCPPKDRRGNRLDSTHILVDRLKDKSWIAEVRARLCSLSWFMKSFQEPIGRRVNKEEGSSGSLWEARYRSIAILDPASLLATCVGIDLKPMRAGVAVSPGNSPRTSLNSRLDHCRSQGNLGRVRAGSMSTRELEHDHWLFPIEARPVATRAKCEGMFQGITLNDYFQLVEWSSNLLFAGVASVKAPASTECLALLDGLQIDPSGWQVTLEKLISPNHKSGMFFGSKKQLNERAAQRGLKYLKNLTGRFFELTSTHDTESVTDSD